VSALSPASSAASLLGAGRLNVSGLATGLDTEKILESLLVIEQRRVEQLQTKQTKFQSQLAAFKGLEAKLLALQNQLNQLARPQLGVFELRNVASSDEGLVTAAASGSAVPGVYQLRVSTLAQTQQFASQGFASPTSEITQGTLQIGLGAGAAATITIDDGNDTLQGLASAINNAAAGVSATIINDGSGVNAQPYRLLLTSTKTGTANTISIANNLTSNNAVAAKPIFDSSLVGAASVGVGYTGTATPTANEGATFTGTSNNTYTFTVLTGGVVGTDNGLQVAYTDATGASTGTLTINAADVDTFLNVTEGIQVKFAAGGLIAGETFSIKGYVPTVQEAADASVTLGSGAGALTVQSTTNQIDNLFAGLAVDLRAAAPGQLVTLTVTSDTAKAKQAIEGFVAGFNDLMTFIDEQIQYNAATSQAGILLGDSQARALQDQIRAAALEPVAGLKTQMNRLGALGITTTDQGRLTINQTKLDDALAGRLAGVSLDDVRRVFALAGKSSNDGIQFVTAGKKTVASATPYRVVVTQAAEQAKITAANPLAASTLIDGTNNVLSISVDGASSGTISLTPGVYSRLGLALELQSKINAHPDLNGRPVAVGLDGDRLTIASQAYGSNSRVTIGAGSALGPLGYLGTETDQGLDVAGHFLVNGVMELATGSGQLLAGLSGNAHTAELQLRVTLTPAQLGGGIAGELILSRGVASTVEVALGRMLDPVSGRMKTISESFQTRIDGMTASIARQKASAAARRDRLLAQFIALERTVSQLQNTSSFLAAQLGQISNLTANQRR
jgi:flagellar hook-associated protein 2